MNDLSITISDKWLLILLRKSSSPKLLNTILQNNNVVVLCDQLLIGIYRNMIVGISFSRRFWKPWSHRLFASSRDIRHFDLESGHPRFGHFGMLTNFQNFAVLRDGMVQSRGRERCAIRFRSFSSCQFFPNCHMGLFKKWSLMFHDVFLEIA